MNSQYKPQTASLLFTSLVVLGLFGQGILLEAGARKQLSERQNVPPEELVPIVRAKEKVLIFGRVLAISDETVFGSEGVAGSADVMLLKIEKVLSGKNPGQYVRADFNHHSDRIDPQKAPALRQLLVPLREGKTMKIRLSPPVSGAACSWPIPAPPKSGEEVGIKEPIMLSVGGANGYPDINTLPCFGFDLNDIEQVTSPDKGK